MTISKQGQPLTINEARDYWHRIPPYPECVVCRRTILRINDACRVEVEDPPTNDDIYVGDISSVNYEGKLICHICISAAKRKNIDELPAPCKLEDLKNKCTIKRRKVKKND